MTAKKNRQKYVEVCRNAYPKKAGNEKIRKINKYTARPHLRFIEKKNGPQKPEKLGAIVFAKNGVYSKNKCAHLHLVQHVFHRLTMV